MEYILAKTKHQIMRTWVECSFLICMCSVSFCWLHCMHGWWCEEISWENKGAHFERTGKCFTFATCSVLISKKRQFSNLWTQKITFSLSTFVFCVSMQDGYGSRFCRILVETSEWQSSDLSTSLIREDRMSFFLWFLPALTFSICYFPVPSRGGGGWCESSSRHLAG